MFCNRCRMVLSSTTSKCSKQIGDEHIRISSIVSQYMQNILQLDCFWPLENRGKKWDKKFVLLFYNAYHDYTQYQELLFYIKLFIHVFVLSEILAMSWYFNRSIYPIIKAIYPFQVKFIHENEKVIDVFSKWWFFADHPFLVI